jgi:hypothetical protein
MAILEEGERRLRTGAQDAILPHFGASHIIRKISHFLFIVYISFISF